MESSNIDLYQYDGSLLGLIFPKTVAWRPLQSQPQKQTSWCCDWRPISFEPPWNSEKERWKYDDQLELLSTKEPIVLQDLLGRRPELVSSLAPTEKSATFFWMIKKHGSVSAGCLYSLFYMFFYDGSFEFLLSCVGFEGVFPEKTQWCSKMPDESRNRVCKMFAIRSVKLRQNPHNVHEWLQRAKLYKDSHWFLIRCNDVMDVLLGCKWLNPEFDCNILKSIASDIPSILRFRRGHAKNWCGHVSFFLQRKKSNPARICSSFPFVFVGSPILRHRWGFLGSSMAKMFWLEWWTHSHFICRTLQRKSFAASLKQLCAQGF